MEWVMWTRDGHTFGKVLMVGSVSWRPSITSIMNGLQMIGYRIIDPRILRLIQKWLKAGVREEGVWSETEAGSPQGAVISPLLSNIYLYYVLDQWTDQWRQAAQGDIVIVRYADDAILGFQHQKEAERYLKQLQEHLRPYGLELNEDKTRLIRFGRFAALNRAERGEGKPETFSFLGFRHICGKTRQGDFVVRRITDSKRRCKKLRDIAKELRRRMHEPVATVGEWLQSVLRGYYNTMPCQEICMCCPAFGGAYCGSGGVFSAGAVNSGRFGSTGSYVRLLAAQPCCCTSISARALRRPHPR